MNVSNFLGELKRRNVYRVAVTYAVVSWLLIQIATQVSPYFEIPNWSVRVLILLLVVCFPVALTLAWAFELTPEGFKRTEDVPPAKSIRHRTGRKLIALSTVVAALALGLMLIRSNGLRALLENHEAVSPPAQIASVPEKSIAVLPFANLSTDTANAFFADGLQDEILASLAKVADLKVISRTSVLVYKSDAARNVREIGRQLAVAHVLEGSVQRLQNRLRVTVQLIDARNDAHLWAEHFDRDTSDAFAIESEIAEAVARELKATFSPAEKAAMRAPTNDNEAFDLYLRAKQLINTFDDAPDRKEAFLRALRLLDEAISRDSKFALAYCWATTAHDNLYWFGLDRSPARLALAKASAQTALALAPDLGEAHLAQALVYYHGSLDYPRALEEVAIAQRSLPNSAEACSLLGLIARRRGQWDDALKNLQRAAELDPRNEKILNALSTTYDVLRRYDEKEALYDRWVAMNPSTRDYCQLMRAETAMEKGNLDAAKTLFDSISPSYDPHGSTTVGRITLALYQRQPDLAAKILADCKLDQLTGPAGVLFPRRWFEALIASARGDAAAARAGFSATRTYLEAQLRDSPDDAKLLGLVGMVNAALGQVSDAISAATRATELLPISKDALDGPTVETYLAIAYAWSGDVGSALDRVTMLAKAPTGLDYGELKYSPTWDAVRHDQRFAGVVASLEPRRRDPSP